MKKLLLALLLMAQSAFALEIQCMEGENHVTVVRSQDSGIVYLVLDDGQTLLNYMALDENFMSIGDKRFSYSDGDLQIVLSNERSSFITSEEALYGDVKTIFPGNCKFL